jgi:hypothetical protein
MIKKLEIEQIKDTKTNDTNVQELNLIEPMPSTSKEPNEKVKFENVLNLLNICNTTYGSSTTGIKKLKAKGNGKIFYIQQRIVYY